METETIEFETSDGVTLTGDLAMPSRPRAAAIVCHPHPQYGGNRFNPIVEAVFTALSEARIAALRFDFRSTFDNGVGESVDAQAALALIRKHVPDVASFATGYSFGALVALSLDEAGVAAKVAIAPPLGHLDVEPPGATPTLVLSPAHDQFAPPEVARPIVARWPMSEFEVIDSVDHFLVGRAGVAASVSVDWLTQFIDADR